MCSHREGRGARSRVAGPTLPVPSSSGLRSTPSKVTLGSGAPAMAARVGSRSRELASSWVTPGGRGLCGHSIHHQGWGQGAGFPEQRAGRLTGRDAAWPEGHGRLSDTTLVGGSLPTPQEARTAAVGHPHGLRSATHRRSSATGRAGWPSPTSKLRSMPRTPQHAPVPSLSYQDRHLYALVPPPPTCT